MPAAACRRLENLEACFSYLPQVVGVTGPAYNCELIASDAEQTVGNASQSYCHFLDQIVAGAMAKGVVRKFQIIEIKQYEAQPVSGDLARMAIEGRSVRQAGQNIVVGKPMPLHRSSMTFYGNGTEMNRGFNELLFHLGWAACLLIIKGKGANNGSITLLYRARPARSIAERFDQIPERLPLFIQENVMDRHWSPKICGCSTGAYIWADFDTVEGARIGRRKLRTGERTNHTVLHEQDRTSDTRNLLFDQAAQTVKRGIESPTGSNHLKYLVLQLDEHRGRSSTQSYTAKALSRCRSRG
ncbi:hypothetical protein FHT28_004568 [Rhizobium sp. SG570]|nr:hypothetical protein [Rhizobium sp. SG570]